MIGAFFEGLDEIMKNYEAYLPCTPKPFELTPVAHRAFREACGLELPILTPEQINLFLQATTAFQGSKNYSFNTGLFLSRLMQDSHKAGHSKFDLDTSALDKQVEYIGYDLSGTEKCPVQLLIRNNAGYGLCEHARYVKVYARRVGDWCGMNAQDLTVIAEKVGYGCGDHSMCMTVYADEVGNYCGFDSCRMTVHTGKIGENYGCGEEEIWKFTLKERSLRMMAKLKRALANGL
ncbi:MAG: hypothetical protein KJ955_00275 [Nanoarchaeota archaeon]|nr:hypothetical protein [Nanoarchaeota archaeon]